MTLLRTATLLAAGACAALAQERAPVEPKSLPAPDQEVAPVTPTVEKLGDNRYRIGKILLDQAKREIRVPTKVNMQEGLLEFLLVHENGKIHESLLLTDISPTHLNLAFTLLRYPPSRELYALPNDHGGESNDYPEVPVEVKTGARIRIEVEWQDGKALRRLPVNEWIQHVVKTTSMPAGPWVYGGSEFHDGKYAPELSGDLIAIFVSAAAIINYPGDDNRDDTVWASYPKRVPAEGTAVTLIVSPFSTDQPLQKP
jgi:hypothetical protein